MRGRKARVIAPAQRLTVGYCRVSTEEQAREGVSLDAQRARIRAYCEAMDIGLFSFTVDAGESAKSLKRPGIAKILAGVRSGSIERVVVLKLDRLTRSTRDLAELLETFAKHNASLVSVSEHLDTQSAAGRLVVNMLGVVAQWEREAIAERTSIALTHKRNNGQVYGRTPFGYRRVGSNLVADNKEQRALLEAQRMSAEGASLRQIADRLTALRVRPKGGGKWYAQSVKSILTSGITLRGPAKSA